MSMSTSSGSCSGAKPSGTWISIRSSSDQGYGKYTLFVLLGAISRLSSLWVSSAGLNRSRFSLGAANNGATKEYEILSGPSQSSVPLMLIDDSSMVDGGPDSRGW